MIHVSGPRRNALKVWNGLYRRRGQWQTSELYGETFRFVGSAPIAELDGYRHWVEPLVGADGRIDAFFADLRTAVAGSGGEMYEKMYERHRENVLDQSLADTFPASDPVSITQPGGGASVMPSDETARPYERAPVGAGECPV